MHKVDNACDDLTAAMRRVRAALRGIPTDKGAFSAHYNRMRRSVGELVVNLAECANLIPDD